MDFERAAGAVVVTDPAAEASSSASRARQIAKSREGGQSRRLRKKIEMLFADLRRILNLGRLRLRRPNGAHDEFFLAAIAQNVGKLAKLIPVPHLEPA